MDLGNGIVDHYDEIMGPCEGMMDLYQGMTDPYEGIAACSTYAHFPNHAP
jgi:hypothetical protein